MATYMTTLMQKNSSGAYDEVLVNGAYTTTTTIATTAWSAAKTATVTINGVTEDCLLFVSPAPNSYKAYIEAGIYCSAQGTNSLTFTCNNVPSSNIIVNVVLM